MRWLPDVIDSILNVIPKEHFKLIEKLKAIKSSSEFAAPEMQNHWWKECGVILEEEIGKPIEKWKRDIAIIFSGGINEN